MLDRPRVVPGTHPADLDREPQPRRQQRLADRDDRLAELALGGLRARPEALNELDRLLAPEVVCEREPQKAFVAQLHRRDRLLRQPRHERALAQRRERVDAALARAVWIVPVREVAGLLE